MAKPIQAYIRRLTKKDMPEVYRIERASFEFPWDEEDFADFLRNRRARGMVAELGKRVVGFAMYDRYRGGSINLFTVAVAPEFRRCGIGSQMVAVLIGRLTRRNAVIDMGAENCWRGRTIWQSNPLMRGLREQF